MNAPPPDNAQARRSFLGYFAALGVGGTLLPGIVWARLQAGAEISIETIRCAEELAGLSFTDAERRMMVDDLRVNAESYRAIRSVPLENDIPPALHFSPLPPGAPAPAPPSGSARRSASRVELPPNEEGVAFLPLSDLSELLRTRQLGSEELTRLYLARIARYDPLLRAVITVTEERALAQAREADREIAAGRYRGPLHGVPWGAKDLLSVRGYPTTWGTAIFREQSFDQDAEVVQRLDAAGAVLVAKLAMGELAWGDVWHDGITRNPWNPEQGASGSSAGPGAATAGGLVGFSIGSETLGSISSPATRNGVTGLRPTFGRIPRTGAMSLSWSMDKLGPMCRSAEDCGLVLDAINGAHAGDPMSLTVGFQWNPDLPLAGLRAGYVAAAFEADSPTRASDVAVLDAMSALGIRLVPIELPAFPYDAISLILSAEAAAAFDAVTREGLDDQMRRQERFAWPNTFRAARTIPAVEYINANRIRTLAMSAWRTLFDQIDLIITPTTAPDQLTATNLTGHPAVILPHGFGGEGGAPTSITLIGDLFREDRVLALAHALQARTDFHRRRPPLDEYLADRPA